MTTQPAHEASDAAPPRWRTLPQRERRFALLVAVAFLLLAGLPTIVAWWIAPPGTTYNGLHALSPGDYPVYYGKMEQVREGAWCFANLATSEVTRCRFDPFWLAAGTSGRAFDWPAPLTFHVLRILLILPLTVLLALTAAAFIRRPVPGWSLDATRRAALLLLAFSSGIGAIAETITRPERLLAIEPSTHQPIDLWISESNTFLAAAHAPHFIASLILLLAVIHATLRFHGMRQWRWSFVAGGAALALTSFHPYLLPAFVGTLLAWVALECFMERRVPWHLLGHTAIIAACAMLAAAYHLSLVATDPGVRAHFAANVLAMPPWPYVALGYGALLPLALAGIRDRFRHWQPEDRLLLAWLIATIVLLAASFPWQRKLTEGLHVALVLLAAPTALTAFRWVRDRIPPRHGGAFAVALRATIATALAVLLLGTSTLHAVSRDLLLAAAAAREQHPLLYTPDSVRAAMQWLRTHAAADDVTLALGLDAHLLPGFAARRSVIGSGHETIAYTEKRVTAEALAGGTLTPDDARAFLTRERVRFILVTDASRDRWTISPASLPGVTLAYRNAGAEVYEQQ